MSVPTHPTTARSRRSALAIGLLFLLTSVFTLAAPVATFAWSSGTFSSSSESDLVAHDQSSPGERRAQGAQGRLDPPFGRPLAQQGHDRPRTTSATPSRATARSGTSSTPSATATTSPARTSAGTTTPTTSRPPRSSRLFMDSRRPPREHHGQGLGRHRHRRLQGPDRQEDVDRPVRRQVRLDGPEADAQAHARSRPPRPTPRPTPKPAAQGDAATDPEAGPPSRRPAPTPGARRPTPSRRRRVARRRPDLPPTTGPAPSRRRAVGSRPIDPAATVSTARSGCAWSIATAPDGLLETIVGGVAGFFFGG